MRRLTEYSRPSQKFGPKGGARVLRHDLTRAAGTPTTQDPIIPGRRVGSPKPDKNRPDRPVSLWDNARVITPRQRNERRAMCNMATEQTNRTM